MTRTRIAIAVVIFALVTGVATWFMTRSRWADEDFSACQIIGDDLVLPYAYDDGDDVRTSFEHDDDGLVVRLQTRADDGPNPTGQKFSEMRIPGAGHVSAVRDHAGRSISCSR